MYTLLAKSPVRPSVQLCQQTGYQKSQTNIYFVLTQISNVNHARESSCIFLLLKLWPKWVQNWYSLSSRKNNILKNNIFNDIIRIRITELSSAVTNWAKLVEYLENNAFMNQFYVKCLASSSSSRSFNHEHN